jgi:hypothetical protein
MKASRVLVGIVVSVCTLVAVAALPAYPWLARESLFCFVGEGLEAGDDAVTR